MGRPSGGNSLSYTCRLTLAEQLVNRCAVYLQCPYGARLGRGRWLRGKGCLDAGLHLLLQQSGPVRLDLGALLILMHARLKPVRAAAITTRKRPDNYAHHQPGLTICSPRRARFRASGCTPRSWVKSSPAPRSLPLEEVGTSASRRSSAGSAACACCLESAMGGSGFAEEKGGGLFKREGLHGAAGRRAAGGGRRQAMLPPNFSNP